MRHRPLTVLASERVAATLQAGDLAVDATVGNGRDTLLMAHAVAPGGHVIGFDIQAQAIETARRRLGDAGLLDVVTLLPCGHERLCDELPDDWHSQVGAVMFNLGYLPGSDRRVTTHADTTLQALDQAFAVLRHGGLLSLIVYRGHPGALHETRAVETWLARLGNDAHIETVASPGPVLHLVSNDPAQSRASR